MEFYLLSLQPGVLQQYMHALLSQNELQTAVQTFIIFFEFLSIRVPQIWKFWCQTLKNFKIIVIQL